MEKPTKAIARIVRQAGRVVDTKMRLARQFEDQARAARKIDFATHAVYSVGIDDMHIQQGRLDGMVETFRELCWEMGADVDVIEGWLEEINRTASEQAAEMLEGA